MNMPIITRTLLHKTKHKLQAVKILNKNVMRVISNDVATSKEKLKDTTSNIREEQSGQTFQNFRFIYPEFLPDPNPLYRNALREQLERKDMLARRSIVPIPEFYVGSILAITYTEPHAPGKSNRFVGICIEKTGCGLRASFLLRNVVDGQGVEVLFNMYDPTLQKIECIRLEKRLDEDLLYLRDAPLQYSTFPFDMDVEILPEGEPVPVNNLVVPLNPPPWLQKYELKNYKGIEKVEVSLKRQKKAAASAKPWEKYDLMKIYRETISEEEQKEIFAELSTQLYQLEITKHKLKHKTFVRPKKVG